MSEITGLEIIKFLEKKFSLKLPAFGILAGQAVASAYFELTKSAFEPVYNDIDVFVYDRFYKEFKEYENLNIEFMDTMDISFVRDYPETMELPRLHFEIKKPYKIIDTSREGMLNRIIMSKDVSAKRVIEGFDLNCVQIGVDLFTGKLYKTGGFDKYLSTGVLKVTSYASPHHTAIRLLNKVHVSGKNDNIEEEMLNIGTFIELDNFWIKDRYKMENIGYFPFFGIKRFKDYEKSSKIKKYFDVYSHENFEMFQLNPEFKTKFSVVDRNMKKFLSSNNQLFSRIGLTEKQKLYLVNEYKDFFMKEKGFDKTVTMGELKTNTLIRIFGKVRLNQFSEKTKKVLFDNISIISSLGINENLILKKLSEKELIKKVSDLSKVFDIKLENEGMKKNRLEIQEEDNVVLFSKIHDVDKFLEKGGNFLSLEPYFKNNIYAVSLRHSFGMYNETIVFSIHKNQIIVLSKKVSKKIDTKKMVLIEKVVNSSMFKDFFVSHNK